MDHGAITAFMKFLIN